MNTEPVGEGVFVQVAQLEDWRLDVSVTGQEVILTHVPCGELWFIDDEDLAMNKLLMWIVGSEHDCNKTP